MNHRAGPSRPVTEKGGFVRGCSFGAQAPASGWGSRKDTSDRCGGRAYLVLQQRKDGRTDRRPRGGREEAGCSAGSADGTPEPPLPGRMSKIWGDGGVTDTPPHQEQRDYRGWPLIRITRPDGDTVSDMGLESTLGSEINLVKI